MRTFHPGITLREKPLIVTVAVVAGRFALVIPFRYTTTLTVVGRGDGVLTLAASHTLGPILGTFRMSAVATATTFDADFTSKNDHGKFVLTRGGK